MRKSRNYVWKPCLIRYNVQNNSVATSGWADVQNNTAITQSCKKPNWADIECKLKESLKFK